MYTDEGIYVITVSNVYTNQTTTKLIYVGTDDVLKAHVTTGLSIGNIESQLAAGATVEKSVPVFGFGLLFRCCLSVVRLLSGLLSESI